MGGNDAGFFLGKRWKSSSTSSFKLQASSGLLRVFEAPSSVLLEDRPDQVGRVGVQPAPPEVRLIWASPATGMNQEKHPGISSH